MEHSFPWNSLFQNFAYTSPPQWCVPWCLAIIQFPSYSISHFLPPQAPSRNIINICWVKEWIMSGKKTDGILDNAIRISSAKQRTRSSCGCDGGRIENSEHSPYTLCMFYSFIYVQNLFFLLRQSLASWPWLVWYPLHRLGWSWIFGNSPALTFCNQLHKLLFALPNDFIRQVLCFADAKIQTGRENTSPPFLS